MRKKLFSIALTGIFLFFSLSIFAQSKTVTGTVTDKDGAGVVGKLQLVIFYINERIISCGDYPSARMPVDAAECVHLLQVNIA